MKVRQNGNLISTAIVCIGLLFFTGCQKQTDSSADGHKTRLLSEESHNLKMQIDKLSKELGQCKEEKDRALSEAGKVPGLTNELQKCNDDKTRIEKEADNKVNLAMNVLPQAMKDENKSLKEENEKLKGEIQKLQETPKTNQ